MANADDSGLFTVKPMLAPDPDPNQNPPGVPDPPHGPTSGGKQPDGTVDNGGIWYHGAWFATPENLKAFGWSDAGWSEFMRKNPAYASWANWHDSTPTPGPGPNNDHPDGTIDEGGGVWYKGKRWDKSLAYAFKASFASDDAWREFLNSFPAVRDWWHAIDTGTGSPNPDPGPDPTKGPPVDWATVFWGGLGLPSDVAAAINKIFAQYPDQTVAQALAQQYLRTTDWYKQTFPGIAYGIRNGMFTDETGYRAYVNNLNNLYQQYKNQAVSGADVANWLQQGKDANFVGMWFQGNQIAQTEGPDAQFTSGAFDPQGALSGDELSAYGQEKAGIDTPLGQKVMQRLQQADRRLQGVFRGTLATPNLQVGSAGGLQASGLQTRTNDLPS